MKELKWEYEVDRQTRQIPKCIAVLILDGMEAASIDSDNVFIPFLPQKFDNIKIAMEIIHLIREQGYENIQEKLSELRKEMGEVNRLGMSISKRNGW